MSTRLVYCLYDLLTFLLLLKYDAFDIGIITTDDFTNADILEATYPAVAKRLLGDWVENPAIPVVTGFLGKVLFLLTLLLGFRFPTDNSVFALKCVVFFYDRRAGNLLQSQRWVGVVVI